MFEGCSIDKRCAEALSSAVRSGRLSHAVILEGGDDGTRFSVAKILAAALVCTGEEPPCGVCRACKKAQNGSHPDIHFLEKEEKSAFIKVDAVRALKEQAMLLPNDGEQSVFVIHEAQYMNVQAQNALLKILEEPAAHVHFLLTVQSRASLLETIRSRSTAYALLPFDAAPASQEADKAKQAAADVLRGLCGNEFELLSACAVFQKDKALLQDALPVMELILRDALRFGSDTVPLTQEQALAGRLQQTFTPKKLLLLREIARDLLDATRANANQNLTATALSALFYEIKERVD